MFFEPCNIYFEPKLTEKMQPIMYAKCHQIGPLYHIPTIGTIRRKKEFLYTYSLYTYILFYIQKG